jgi:peptide/nickel transport system substrate-binding protein
MLPTASAGIAIDTTKRLFNATLAYDDERGAWHPYLAEALPELNTDSWRVFPDGRMETTYRIKPNLTWHDGQPFTTDDIAFAVRVYQNPEFGIAASIPQVLIEEVATPDPRTVVIRWHRPYAGAATLPAAFLPLPRHILEGPLQSQSMDAFSNHPYWTQQYVGLGPYRIDRWEPGTAIEAVGFTGHALGAPKIPRMRLVFIADYDAIVANLLAGGAHIAIDGAVRVQQASVLRQEWAASKAGVVLSWPQGTRFTYAQLRQGVADPTAMMDLRVRKALAHTIDKQMLNDGLLDGHGVIADTFLLPGQDYYAAVQSAVARYPYDVRRSEQLMQEAGFTKDGEGFYVSATQERFNPELQITATAPHFVQEGILLQDTWRRAGFDVGASMFPQAMMQDGQARATFRSMATALCGCRSEMDTMFPLFTSNAIPRTENRWRGSNRGSWSNTEWDRLADTFATTLEKGARTQLAVQMMRMVSEDLPGFPYYYDLTSLAHTATLQGPLPVNGWNVHQWTWSS